MYSITELDPAALPPLGDAARWPARRAAIDRIWRDYVGPLPEPITPSYRVIETGEVDGVPLQRIRYAAPGASVPAYLLTPPAGAARGRPAVLALHQTTDMGKDEVIGRGRRSLQYGLELARRGYVVLAPDTVTRGERIHPDDQAHDSTRFYAENPGWTTVGRMVTDHRQGVSLLQSLPGVDPSRIGAIGHSLGGYNAFFLAGLDARVAATVCSCGLGVFAQDPTPQRWCRDDFFDHLPRLRADLAAGVVPWEWHEILALVAPRPLFVWWTQNDDCFPNVAAVGAAVDSVHRLFDGLGAGPACRSMVGDGPHDFPADARAAAYQFLDEHLHR